MLTKDKGKSTAAIRVLKEGQKRLVVEAIRFPLIVWDNSPRIVVNGINKALRIYEDISGYRSESKYVSDEAVEYSDGGGEMKDNDVLYAYVDLDRMMEVFIRSRESLIHPIFFRLMLLELNVEVHCTNGKIYKQKAHREIKYYIKRKYMNDQRLY